jgi:hypothetical protein
MSALQRDRTQGSSVQRKDRLSRNLQRSQEPRKKIKLVQLWNVSQPFIWKKTVYEIWPVDSGATISIIPDEC